MTISVGPTVSNAHSGGDVKTGGKASSSGESSVFNSMLVSSLGGVVPMPPAAPLSLAQVNETRTKSSGSVGSSQPSSSITGHSDLTSKTGKVATGGKVVADGKVATGGKASKIPDTAKTVKGMEAAPLPTQTNKVRASSRMTDAKRVVVKSTVPQTAQISSSQPSLANIHLPEVSTSGSATADKWPMNHSILRAENAAIPSSQSSAVGGTVRLNGGKVLLPDGRPTDMRLGLGEAKSNVKAVVSVASDAQQVVLPHHHEGKLGAIGIPAGSGYTPLSSMPAALPAAPSPEPMHQVNLRNPQSLAQFGQLISVKADQSQSQLQVQVIPQGMGQLNVTVTQQSNGLHVELVANQASTFALLNQQIPQLQNSMVQAGLTVSQFSLSYQQQDERPGRSFRDGKPQQKSVGAVTTTQSISGVNSRSSGDALIGRHRGDISVSI